MDKVETTVNMPQMCECGRLYKDRRDENGKMICSACYSDCSVEDLKLLWGTPVKSFNLLKKKEENDRN